MCHYLGTGWWPKSKSGTVPDIDACAPILEPVCYDNMASLVFRRVLAEVAGILEPIGLQEEAELPARILEEFVRVCVRWDPAFQVVEAGPRIAYCSSRQHW